MTDTKTDITLEDFNQPGFKVQFKSIYYMGLGTHKKRDWWTGYIRKIDDTHIYLVYVNPFAEKMYAAIPIQHLKENKVEILWRINDDEINEDIIKIDVDYHIDLWHEYKDREAIKIIGQNIMARSKQ